MAPELLFLHNAPRKFSLFRVCSIQFSVKIPRTWVPPSHYALLFLAFSVISFAKMLWLKIFAFSSWILYIVLKFKWEFSLLILSRKKISLNFIVVWTNCVGNWEVWNKDSLISLEFVRLGVKGSVSKLVRVRSKAILLGFTKPCIHGFPMWKPPSAAVVAAFSHFKRHFSLSLSHGFWSG